MKNTPVEFLQKHELLNLCSALTLSFEFFRKPSEIFDCYELEFGDPEEVMAYCDGLSEFERLKLLQTIVNVLVQEEEALIEARQLYQQLSLPIPQ